MRPGKGADSENRVSGEPPNDYMSVAARIEAFDHPLEAAELADVIRVAKSTIYGAARAIPPRIPHIRWGTVIRFDPAATAEWYRRLYCGCEGFQDQNGKPGKKDGVRMRS